MEHEAKGLMKVRLWFRLLFLGVLVSTAVQAQNFEFYPGAKYDPAIPTLKQVVGHEWGERITMHHEMERYLSALQQASGGRLVPFTRSWDSATETADQLLCWKGDGQQRI